MAAFAAVSSLGLATANLIRRCGLVLADNDPDFLENLKIADKELKLFKEFVEGLDMRSRMRMSASLQRIPEATKRFDEAVNIYLDSEEDSRDMEDLRQETYSLIDTLKKTKEEYLKLNEAIVDSGGNKSVELSDKYSQLKTELTLYWLDDLVFTLFGMAGIGKTLLAKKVFEDLDIMEWFECRAWVTVGRKYQPEEITQSIQAQLDIGAHDMRESLMVADLLRKYEMAQWIEISTHKKHQLFIDAYEEIHEVLYPSYDNLREDSKLCFLYMAVFPEKFEIFKSKLINLWIVEKLIEQDNFQTSKNFGVECLKYLTVHNLVMVHQKSSNLFDDLSERIKSCALHSSWWHFCYKEARKTNFFHVLDSYTDALGEVIKRQRRLTIHNNTLFGVKKVRASIEKNCESTVHSLLCLGPYQKYPVPMCFGLKLLKKLDALHIRFHEFPLEVLELFKLRYLALTCNASLPPSISKLSKLQYLIVRQHLSIKFGVQPYFPVEIWDMKRLKHLHVTNNDLLDVIGTLLPNLSTLLDVSVNSCTNGVFGRIPNLKKLGIQIELMPDAVVPQRCFDHVSNLSELESLKCVVVNPTCNFVAPFVPLSVFPLNLKKLHLNGLGCCWKEMSMISSLPNLEVLKLRSNAFQGPIWIVEEDEFPKLSFLLMEDMDLEVLKGRNESFKSLIQVSIQHCYKLRKLRWRSGYALHIDIKVVYCNPQVEKEIQKSAPYLNGKQKVLIYSDWNA